ncbi:hypothetical protein BofuT4_P088280.1 [Botrytis cinerea T4]|uniref:Uncharacterized protein n=1 Tax=Botryotinia fuckeliana (strain T4) TaxID=999810 RepID=G2YG67_BOTF4|nr:hypothetical protein BofuT4_P088280.1 [Botrytis cinerea T4]
MLRPSRFSLFHLCQLVVGFDFSVEWEERYKLRKYLRLWGNALGFLPGENIFHLPGEYSAPFLNLTGADLLNDRAGLVIRSLTLSEYDGGVLVVVLVLVFYVLRTRLLGEIPGSRAFGEHGFATLN